jgi:hypothetical protein
LGGGWCPPSSSFRRKPESILILLFVFSVRCRDNRLTSVCVSSTIHGRRLLSFACPKESNQRKRHPRIRALGFAEGSLRADGFRPQAIHGLLSKSARSLAPPALRAADPSTLRRYSEGTRRAKRKSKEETDVSDISGVAYIRCFCGRDCRALLFRVPSRPRRAGGGNSRAQRGHAQDARAFDESTGMCSRRTPEPARVVTRAGMPA